LQWGIDDKEGVACQIYRVENKNEDKPSWKSVFLTGTPPNFDLFLILKLSTDRSVEGIPNMTSPSSSNISTSDSIHTTLPLPTNRYFRNSSMERKVFDSPFVVCCSPLKQKTHSLTD
jgi:hypothetical protein